MPALDGDWRAVLLLYAGVSASAVVVWLLLSRPSTGSPRPDHRVAESQIGVVAALLRVDAVRVVLVISVGVFFFNHGLNNWLPEILRAGGMSPAAAGYWAALPTAVGVAGSLLVPRLARGGACQRGRGTRERSHVARRRLCAGRIARPVPPVRRDILHSITVTPVTRSLRIRRINDASVR